MRARSIGTPPGAEGAERSLRERRGQDHPEALLHVVRAERNGSRSDSASVERMDAQHAVVAARHERAVVDERDVLRRRVGRDRADQPARARVVDRDPAPVARGDPDAPAAGREADVVREEGRPHRPDDPRPPRLCEAQHRDRVRLAPERDPEPAARSVDPEVAGWTADGASGR